MRQSSLVIGHPLVLGHPQVKTKMFITHALSIASDLGCFFLLYMILRAQQKSFSSVGTLCTSSLVSCYLPDTDKKGLRSTALKSIVDNSSLKPEIKPV